MDEQLAKIRAQLESIIHRSGWAVQGVFPTEESPGPHFCYSIGLHDKGLPELLVFGLPLNIGQALINDVARMLMARQQESQALPLGKNSLENWPTPFILLEAEAALAEPYATGARRRSQGKASYLQVCWPDKAGRFPWQPGVNAGFLEAQPLLGQSPKALLH